MSFLSRLKSNRKFDPSITYFDLLYSEYRSLDPPVPDGPDKARLDYIKERRDDSSLPREEKFSWDDIYKFELTLLKYLPLDRLRSKILFLRDEFENIYGKVKLSDYLKDNPLIPATETDLVKFRAEAQYLLHQIYLPFAALSSREGLGKWLTEWAGSMIVLIIIGVAAILFFFLPRIGITGTPIKIAFLGGAIGGLVSVLQRIQSISFEGDPIYNLATFWNGAYALFVSPFTGAIFGVLLYFLFTGGVLQGRFFPNIATPYGADINGMCGEMTTNKLQSPPTPTPTPSTNNNSNNSNTTTNTNATNNAPPLVKTTTPTTTASNTNMGGNMGGNLDTGNTNTSNMNQSGNTNVGNVNRATTTNQSNTKPANTNATNINAANINAASSNANPSNTNGSNDNSRAPQNGQVKIGNSGLRRFLDCSGPESGFDYALLILWCFIAGFAERLVPDTLNRLADENGPQKKT